MTASTPSTARKNMKNHVCHCTLRYFTIASAMRMSGPSGTEHHDCFLLNESLSLRKRAERVAMTVPARCSLEMGTRSCFKYFLTGSASMRLAFRPRLFGRIVHTFSHFAHRRLFPPCLMIFALQQGDFACFLFIQAKYAQKTTFQLTNVEDFLCATHRINLFNSL